MTEHPEIHAARHRAALEVATTNPTQHVPRLVTRAEIRTRMHGDSAAGRFNSRLAVLITRGVGTMWAAYLFVLIAFISLPQALAAFLAIPIPGIFQLNNAAAVRLYMMALVIGPNFARLYGLLLLGCNGQYMRYSK